MGSSEPVEGAPLSSCLRFWGWEASMIGVEAEQLLWHRGPGYIKEFFSCPLRPSCHHVSTVITCISRRWSHSRSSIDPFQKEPVSSPPKVPKLSNISHPSLQSTDFPSSQGNRAIRFGLRFAELPSIYCFTSLNLPSPLLNIRRAVAAESLSSIGVGMTVSNALHLT